MTSEASINSNSLGTYKYYEYNDTNSAPTAIGPMVGDWSSYKLLGSDSYTADEIHNNMRIMYDKICEEERISIDNENIQRQPGLSISTLNNLYTTSDDFSYAVPSVEFMTESVSIPKGKSVELSGYFIPSKTGLYQLSSSGKSIDSWIGDVAIYEYTDSNRMINNIELNHNYYYAVRFQAKNEGDASLTLNISVTCNGELVTNPQFVTLFKNGDRYERKLLYYGLISNSNSNGKYYCYYDYERKHDMIIESKYKTVLEMTVVLPFDTQPRSTTASINDGQQTAIASSTSVFDVKVNSASYITNPTYENVTEPRTVIDWANAYEYYPYKGTRWVIVRNWWGIRRKVQRQYTETRRRQKNPLPTKVVSYTWRRKIDPLRVNVIGEVSSAAGTTIQPSDVTGARNGTLTVNTTSTVKPNTAKSISMDTSGNIVVTYNNTTPITLVPAPNPYCSSKMIKINNNGSVTACDVTLTNPMNPSDQLTFIPNNIWKAQGLSHILVAGTPLTTIISQDSRFKLEMSPDSTLQFKFCFKAYEEIGTVKFTKAINQSLYLYRPTYNRLGGKMYLETISGNQLIQVKSNDNTLKFSSFSSVSGGYPLFPSEYETKIEPTTPAKCGELCQNEPNCGNYVTYGNSGCMLDGTYNNKPNYSMSSKISTPNIYIKKYKMDVKPEPMAFTQTDSSGFSGYTIINDANIPQTKLDTTTDTSLLIDAKSDLSNASFDLVQLTSEPFQGQGRDIPARFLNTLPEAPDSSVEEGRIDDLQMILFQHNMLYSLSSIAALTFLASAIVLAHK